MHKMDEEQQGVAGDLKEEGEPWGFSAGCVPERGSPLYGVFVAGMTYTEKLLCDLLGVKQYELGYGGTDPDTNVTASLRNILIEAGMYDPKGGRFAKLAPSKDVRAMPPLPRREDEMREILCKHGDDYAIDDLMDDPDFVTVKGAMKAMEAYAEKVRKTAVFEAARLLEVEAKITADPNLADILYSRARNILALRTTGAIAIRALKRSPPDQTAEGKPVAGKDGWSQPDYLRREAEEALPADAARLITRKDVLCDGYNACSFPDCSCRLDAPEPPSRPAEASFVDTRPEVPVPVQLWFFRDLDDMHRKRFFERTGTLTNDGLEGVIDRASLLEALRVALYADAKRRLYVKARQTDKPVTR